MTLEQCITHRAIAITCALLAATLSINSYAIEAFQATYAASIKSKMAISGTLKRSLTKTADGQWLLQDNISSFLASIDESSQLNIIKDKVQPLNYEYVRKVLGKKKKRAIAFDWTKKQATNRDQKVIELQPNALDRLSYQLQLQIDLQNGKRGKFSYAIAKNSSLETMNFIEIGTEYIKTPLGNLNSIKLKLDRGKNAKRETFIWFSLKHNFIITQLKQTEADGKTYSIILNKLS